MTDTMTTLRPDLSARDVAAALGISPKTFSRLPWWRARKHRPSPGRVTYAAADVELYRALQRDTDTDTDSDTDTNASRKRRGRAA